jgi:hypothetical protein
MLTNMQFGTEQSTQKTSFFNKTLTYYTSILLTLPDTGLAARQLASLATPLLVLQRE